MKATLRLLEVDMRLSGAFVRLSLSRDANPDPCYHRIFLVAGSVVELRWKSASPNPDSALIWEACVMERAPVEEGGEPEPVIAGGAVSPARGRHRVVLRDFYSDEPRDLGTLLVEIEGLDCATAIAPSAPEAADVARLQRKYEAYYEIARPSVARDVRMRVPSFRFYGGEVQASYLTIMTADMDPLFAEGVLGIVLEEAGMTELEFVEIGRRQLASPTYLRETDALVARLGECATFTANLMRYRSDLSAPVRARRRELIEKIVPHVREERGGDCEDLALEIYFVWKALQRLSGRRAVAKIASLFAHQYQPFVVGAVATAPAAGGNARGEMLHVFAIAIPTTEVAARMPAHYGGWAAVPDYPWVGDLPALAPLEGTNWCDALHLPQDRFYGSVAADASALGEVERREKLAREISPSLRAIPTRIRQRLGAPLSDEGFSGFYRRVVEAWSDFSMFGSCCFSVRRATTGRFGVSLGEIASKGDYDFAVVFEHSAAEFGSIRRAMRTVAPVPAWKGRVKKASVEGLPRTASLRPRRASRLHADAIVYHFRSRELATSAETRAAFAALAERFDLDCRAWKLPPDGSIEYIAVYAREKKKKA